MAVPSSTAPPAKRGGPDAADLPLRALIGLGNPGKQYAATRHNIGFVVIQHLAVRLGASWSAKFHGEFARCRMSAAESDCDMALLQPQKFMNLSGHAVQAMAQFYGFRPGEMLVVHDDLDLPFGKIQLKVGGGHGGHNGLRSIAAQLGTTDFCRLRVGIGRPGAAGPAGVQGGETAIADWVLSAFSPDERAELVDIVARGTGALCDAVRLGTRAAMNSHNGGAARASATKPLNSAGS